MTSPARSSADRIEVSPSGRSSTPSVTAAGVKECPAPVIRTVSPSAAARLTSSATSPADRGTATRRGRAVTLPAQLRQPSVPVTGYRSGCASAHCAAARGPGDVVPPGLAPAGRSGGAGRSLDSPARQISAAIRPDPAA